MDAADLARAFALGAGEAVGFDGGALVSAQYSGDRGAFLDLGVDSDSGKRRDTEAALCRFETPLANLYVVIVVVVAVSWAWEYGFVDMLVGFDFACAF